MCAWTSAALPQTCTAGILLSSRYLPTHPPTLCIHLHPYYKHNLIHVRQQVSQSHVSSGLFWLPACVALWVGMTVEGKSVRDESWHDLHVT